VVLNKNPKLSIIEQTPNNLASVFVSNFGTDSRPTAIDVSFNIRCIAPAIRIHVKYLPLILLYYTRRAYTCQYKKIPAYGWY